MDFLAQSSEHEYGSEIFGNTNQDKPNYYQGIVNDFFQAIYNSVVTRKTYHQLQLYLLTLMGQSTTALFN